MVTGITASIPRALAHRHSNGWTNQDGISGLSYAHGVFVLPTSLSVGMHKIYQREDPYSLALALVIPDLSQHFLFSPVSLVTTYAWRHTCRCIWIWIHSAFLPPNPPSSMDTTVQKDLYHKSFDSIAQMARSRLSARIGGGSDAAVQTRFFPTI